MKCVCCQRGKAYVMAPKCDICYLGVKECCKHTKALERAITDSFKDVSESWGYYEAPFTNPVRLEKIKQIEALKR